MPFLHQFFINSLNQITFAQDKIILRRSSAILVTQVCFISCKKQQAKSVPRTMATLMFYQKHICYSKKSLSSRILAQSSKLGRSGKSFPVAASQTHAYKMHNRISIALCHSIKNWINATVYKFFHHLPALCKVSENTLSYRKETNNLATYQ